MSLLSQLKTTVKKSPAKPAVPAIEPPTPAATESVSTSPADDICDLETLAGRATRVAALAEQRIIACGTPDEVLAVDHPFIHRFFCSEHAKAVMHKRLV